MTAVKGNPGIQTNVYIGKQQVVHMTFMFEIPNIETLSRILALQDQIPDVSCAGRSG